MKSPAPSVLLLATLLLTVSAQAQNRPILQPVPRVPLQQVPLQLPSALQLRLQTLPSFGAPPPFKALDSATSNRFLNGNTIWLTAPGLEASRQARLQNFSANLARLQPLASQPRIQAVLNAAKLQGLQEPLLQVQTKSGPLTIKLLSADVGASIAARELGQDAEANARVAVTRMAQDMDIDPAVVGQVAQAVPAQRLNTALQLQPSLARILGNRPLLPIMSPVGTGNGLDAVPNSCAPASGKLFALYDFPMKKNLPAVKNQGGRGTCWAFATISVAETLIRTQYGRRVDLSEQDYVAYSKLKYGSPTDGDGADPFALLGLNAQNGYRFAYEKVWEYNQSLSRSATETPPDSGKYNYQNSCGGYPHQDQCEDSVSQAETGCIVTAGKTVCGAQIPTERTSYGIDTSSLKNMWDWNQKDGGLGWSVLALGFGTPVMLLHDARYLQGDANGFVGDLPYNRASHPVKQADGSTKWEPNTEKDVAWWNHIAMLVGYVSNQRLQEVMPGAPAGPGGGYFIMKNSWGTCWSDGGYIYLSWDWMKKYAGGLYLGTRITN
ncbi:C1 family peptidase [Deinococcus fonticola]|uniref:C1 family peptidase n=1 Tax=Deinococcus fonticola TaxID=2528713 RepID=UPI001074BD99|nr:C1 family peptidase [Deinococcus fonticola]